MVAAVASAFHVDLETAERGVTAAVRRLAELGLLDGGDDVIAGESGNVHQPGGSIMSDSQSSKSDAGRGKGETRREILKKAVYVAPTVLTFAVSPAFAQAAGRGRAASPGAARTRDGSRPE